MIDSKQSENVSVISTLHKQLRTHMNTAKIIKQTDRGLITNSPDYVTGHILNRSNKHEKTLTIRPLILKALQTGFVLLLVCLASDQQMALCSH